METRWAWIDLRGFRVSRPGAEVALGASLQSLPVEMSVTGVCDRSCLIPQDCSHDPWGLQLAEPWVNPGDTWMNRVCF